MNLSDSLVIYINKNEKRGTQEVRVSDRTFLLAVHSVARAAAADGNSK